MVDLRVSSGHLLRYAGGGGGSGEPKKIMGLAIAGLRIALAGGVDERGACQWWYAGMSLRYVGRSAVVEGKSRGSKGRMWRVEEAEEDGRARARTTTVALYLAYNRPRANSTDTASQFACGRRRLHRAWHARACIRCVIDSRRTRERHYRGARVAREIGLPASVL